MQEGTFYPLTSPQLSIWYTENIFPGTSISNISGTMRIKDEFSFDILEQVVNLLIKTNDSLRIRICLNEDGQPCQYIVPYGYMAIEFVDFTAYDEPIQAMYTWDTLEKMKPFKLIDHDLFRFVIFKLGDMDGGIYLNVHHIISDAWSMSLAGNDAIGYYNLLKADSREASDVIQKPSYAIFVQAEQEYVRSNRFIKDRLFWEQQYSKLPEASVLKTKQINVTSTTAKRKTFVAPKKFTNALKKYCSKMRISPYPLFMSAFFLYVNRVTGKEDIVIGTPLLNRLSQTEKNTFGMFINILPLRMQIKQKTSFSEFSHAVNELCLSAYRHQRYPYESLQKYVREKHGLLDNLYDIVFSYQNTKFAKKEDLNFSTRWHFSGHQVNSLTVHINDRDDEDLLIIDYDYHSALYHDKEIEFIHQHLLTLLWHAIDNPEKNIFTYEMLPENEKKKILHEFNNTQKPFPHTKTIHQLFEEQVTQTPDHDAIIFGKDSLTYHALNHKANALAHYLRKNGVKPDDLVGIMVGRSMEMMVAILAVLKAGAAFVPIDPNYPEKRIRFMLEDSGIRLLLTQFDGPLYENELSGTKFIDLNDNKLYQYPSSNLEHVNLPNHLIYLMYTSGSTGNPKGVMIEHGSVVNFVFGLYDFMDYQKIHTVLSIGSFSFDIFISEVFPALLKGATIVLPDDNERKDPKLLSALIKKHKVDFMVATPSQVASFMKEPSYYKEIKNLYGIMLGGEAVPDHLLMDLKKCTDAIIVNAYGPVETTVMITAKELSKSNRVSLGRPMNNIRIYILDKHMLPVPIGIEGEIYVGGTSLARGYLNRPDLNRDRFVEVPFLQGEKLYRTGDIAKWYPRGEISYVGRSDFQVKIRGLRIELGEIEKRMMMIDHMRKVVVTAAEVGGKKEICAYYTSDNEISEKEIRLFLSQYLPVYMIPSFLIRQEYIPLSPNGKVDIEALPKLNISQFSKGLVKPKNQMERDILSIWQDILKDQNFGVQDEYYAIGGDSLSIIQIVSRINVQFNVSIPVCDINGLITVEKMAELISAYSQKEISSQEASVVMLKKGHDSDVFLIHAGNGEISCYHELSRLISNDFTVWAFKADDDLVLNNKVRDMHELATLYVDRLIKIKPEGPYHLAGWCIGGSIAFEMAQILERCGDHVSSVTLFNSIAPQQWKKNNQWTYWIKDKDFTHFMQDFESDCFPLNPDTLPDVLLDLLRKGVITISSLVNRLPEEIRTIIPGKSYENSEEVIRYLRRITLFYKLRADYYPSQKVNAPVYFFSAKEEHHFDPKTNIGMWNDFCEKKMTSYQMNSDHHTLLSSPVVLLVSKVMNTYLKDNVEEAYHHG